MASRKHIYVVMPLLLMLVLTGCQQATSRIPLIENLQARSQALSSQRQQAQHVAAGNTAYVEGDLTSAEARYQDALDLNPTLAVALHNQGNIDYRNALWDDAQAHYEDALEHHQNSKQTQPDVNPWAASHYNLGNIYYHTSQQAEADPSTLTNALSDAIEHYKDALREDPTDKDTKYNLELALRQQASQPPPPEEQPQDGEEQQDEQEQESETPPEDGEPQDDESQESPPQDGDSQDGNDSQEDGPDNDNEQPSESQEGDEQEDDAEPQEDDSDGNSDNADEQEGDDSEDTDPEDSDANPEGEAQDASANPQQPLVMTPAQAAQLLEAAVGQSETLQAYLQQATSPLPPPEQDW